MTQKTNKNLDEKNKKTRRDFLRLGLTIGAGSIVGVGGFFSGMFTNKEETAASGNTFPLMTADGRVVQVDTSHITPVDKEQMEIYLDRGRIGISGKKWVMVIDLSKCRNARKCMDACQSAHHLKPEQHHINVLRMKDADYTEPYFMPKPCYHCDNPPCTKVCPVDATFKRQDGIVLIDNERCIGCRFCIAACPYSARIFNWTEPKQVVGDESRTYDVELNVPQKKGTVSKCLFSADRLREGKLPYCVSACPNGVYWFGDRNEDAVTNGTNKETVSFSKLLRDNAGYTVMEELGTKPSVYYLPAKNRMFPFEYEGKTTIDDTHG